MTGFVAITAPADEAVIRLVAPSLGDYRVSDRTILCTFWRGVEDWTHSQQLGTIKYCAREVWNTLRQELQWGYTEAVE